MYEAGTIVAGKYRIDQVLGSGGMGVVVAATHLQLGTPVALKFMHEQMTQNASVVERFMREAQSSARLRGENVCRVSDVGNENGQPYIVMELLTGQDLGTVLRANGQLPVAMAAEIIMQACIALGEAHALGFVHRDIKPGNLFWTQRPDGTALIKVLDFGVAKAPDELNFSLTQTANVIGSPGYMSPEQLKSSKTVDPRSDIWSLGIVLYELVSGRKPFHGESITELALKVAMDPTPPLSGGIPSTFESVMLRCLEKEPARRYRDVAELASALAPFVGPVRGAELAYAVGRTLKGAHTPVPGRASAQGAASTPTTLRGANGVVAASGITSKRSWRLPVVMGSGALVGVVLALVLVTGKKHDTSAAKAADPAEPAKVESMKVEPAKPAAPAAAGAADPAPAPPPVPVAEKKAAPPAAAPAAKVADTPAAKVADTPAAKVADTPAARVADKPAMKVADKPAPKAEPKPEPKPEPKAEPKPEPKTVAKTEPKHEAAKAEAKPTTKPKTTIKSTKTTKATKPKEDVGDSRL